MERDLAIHRLYLESESFPVEVYENEDILTLVKQRDWFRDSIKLI